MQHLANSTDKCIITAFSTEHLQHSYLAIGSAPKIWWGLGWEVIKPPNKFSYTVTLLEVIAILPGWFRDFQNFQYFKRNNTFPFCKKDISDQGSCSDTLFRRRENSGHTHMFTSNFRKMSEILGQMLCSLLENGPKGNGKDCVFKGSKLVAGSFRQVEETSGEADNRLTSWNVGLTMMTSDRKLKFLIVTLEKDLKLQTA